MREETHVSKQLVAEARRLGVLDAHIERAKKHPRLVGTIYGVRIAVGFAGTSRDRNAFSIGRQYLRRELRRASETNH